MKNASIKHPCDMSEPNPGDLLQLDNGKWYLCLPGSDCAECDVHSINKPACCYKSICSCFKRNTFNSVVFRAVANIAHVVDSIEKSQRHESQEKSGSDSNDDHELFETGAVRDSSDDKPRPELISPFATDRLARWLALGAKKYAPRNWERGIPVSRCFASLHRHLMMYQEGDRSEDHLAAAYCNMMFCLHFEEMAKRGLLPATLLDLPFYPRANINKTHA